MNIHDYLDYRNYVEAKAEQARMTPNVFCDVCGLELSYPEYRVCKGCEKLYEEAESDTREPRDRTEDSLRAEGFTNQMIEWR